ncbi:hypothetical protein H634G_10337 [Metarhizium anisopliae BRIP 53293]|uniref:Beta-lactamase-related domain-containing protein n=1 Tax=Metarhizium anisopliae BRIP 53293 TaxID=1291518 RepID=A0A0D9NP92_METAN|nr:hypothetical protein H634G_10337 [Metarhizium anisopliae BRIP 53293]KJK85553.1 hypothetical protein H633G_10601 [Metarhizium anisopliae BRIP 53284]
MLEEERVPGLLGVAVDSGEEYAQARLWICRLPRYPSNSGAIIARRLDTKAFVDAALAQRILNGSHSVPNGGWSTPIASIIRDDFVLQDEDEISTKSEPYSKPLQSALGGSPRVSTFGTFVFWFRDLRYAIAIFGNTAGPLNSVETLLSRGVIEDRLEVPKDRRIGEHQNLRDKIVNAFDVLYTERRSPRLPPTENTTHLAGTNLDPGYGTTQLKETTDPEDAASTVLVGSNGSGIIIDSDVLLRHVSGGYWVLHLSSAEVPQEIGAALAAEFKFGSDGNTSALKNIWDQAKPGLRDVKVLLNKVE